MRPLITAEPIERQARLRASRRGLVRSRHHRSALAAPLGQDGGGQHEGGDNRGAGCEDPWSTSQHGVPLVRWSGGRCIRRWRAEFPSVGGK